MLFDVPGIQIQVWIFTTLLYIIFVSSLPKFDPPIVLTIELINEAIFLVIEIFVEHAHNALMTQSLRFLDHCVHETCL